MQCVSRSRLPSLVRLGDPRDSPPSRGVLPVPPSKQVLDREKSTRAVVAAADTHAADIAAAITRELSAHLRKGETLPDLTLLGHLIGRKLKADFDVLVRADRVHEGWPVTTGASRAAPGSSQSLQASVGSTTSPRQFVLRRARPAALSSRRILRRPETTAPEADFCGSHAEPRVLQQKTRADTENSRFFSGEREFSPPDPARR